MQVLCKDFSFYAAAGSAFWAALAAERKSGKDLGKSYFRGKIELFACASEQSSLSPATISIFPQNVGPLVQIQHFEPKAKAILKKFYMSDPLIKRPAR
jgi:hypothetical protein